MEIVEALPEVDDEEAQSYVDRTVAPELNLQAGELVPKLRSLKRKPDRY